MKEQNGSHYQASPKEAKILMFPCAVPIAQGGAPADEAAPADGKAPPRLAVRPFLYSLAALTLLATSAIGVTVFGALAFAADAGEGSSVAPMIAGWVTLLSLAGAVWFALASTRANRRDAQQNGAADATVTRGGPSHHSRSVH